MGRVAPLVNRRKQNDSWCHVADEAHLAAHLGHQQRGIEKVREHFLFVGGRKILNRAAHARRGLWWHADVQRIDSSTRNSPRQFVEVNEQLVGDTRIGVPAEFVSHAARKAEQHRPPCIMVCEMSRQNDDVL